VIHRETRRARLYELEKNYTAAISTLNHSLELSRKHNFRSFESDIHKQLRDLCKKTDDFAGYIANNEAHDKINSDIRGSETSRHLVMQEKEREIEIERQKHEKQKAVLHSTLPQHVAERVIRGEVVNDTFDKAAVIFVDIVGFTAIADKVPPVQVVKLLEQIFTTFDAVCEKHNIVKIKTIGDSYLAVAFESSEVKGENSELRAANAALGMLAALGSLSVTMPPELGDTDWTKDIGEIQVRIGVHIGPVTAGVIGTQRMQYDVWGDTVNVASRMESTGEAGRIQVSEAFACHPAFRRTKDDKDDKLSLLYRGETEIKGKGKMKTFWLVGD
jgi:adenylate cyclase